jgi:hypothetical protein
MIVSTTKAFSDLNFLLLIPNGIDAVSGRSGVSLNYSLFYTFRHMQEVEKREGTKQR